MEIIFKKYLARLLATSKGKLATRKSFNSIEKLKNEIREKNEN